MNLQSQLDQYDILNFKNEKGTGNTDIGSANPYDNFFNEGTLNQNFKIFHEKIQDDWMMDYSNQAKSLDCQVEQLAADEIHERNISNNLAADQQNFSQGKLQPIQKQSEKLQLQQKEKPQLPQISETQFELDSSDQQGYEKDYKLNTKWRLRAKRILRDDAIQQLSTKHNRNMGKFFLPKFIKYYREQVPAEEQDSKLISEIEDFCSNDAVKKEDLAKIFGSEQSSLQRKLLNQMLRKNLDKEIIKNPNVIKKNRMAYLICSKVYALRCRSKHLVNRLVSK